jgi:hypothetical protein
MAPIEFDIPEEEDPEPGTPVRIEHGCDYMLLPDGTLEYHYNYLIYHWENAGEEISGRTYLDYDLSRVSVFVSATRLRDDATLQPIVRFLQRRFSIIQSFHESDEKEDEATGYCPVYLARGYRAKASPAK